MNGTAAEQIPLQVVSGNYFSVLGVQPARGRAFTPEEDRRATAVIVLSHGFWERSLGGDPGAVGKTITLNRTPFTIVGVTPQGFTGTLLGGGPAGWVPMAIHDVVQPGFDWYEQRRGLFLFAFGRLKPGVSVEQASANLRTIFAQLEQAYPVENKGRSAGAHVAARRAREPGRRRRRANRATVDDPDGHRRHRAAHRVRQHGQSAARARDRAAPRNRGASGARRRPHPPGPAAAHRERAAVAPRRCRRPAPRLLAASSALAGTDLQLPLPVDDELSLDRRVLLFTLLLSVTTGVLFGLAPAIQASRADVVPVLKNELVPAGTARRGAARWFGLRQTLVVAQLALSLVALIGAGIFLRSLLTSERSDTGFETDGVLVMTFNLGREGYTPERGQLFYEEAAEPHGRAARRAARPRWRRMPPLAGGLLRSIFPEGADTTTGDRVLVQVNSVIARLLRTRSAFRCRAGVTSPAPTRTAHRWWSSSTRRWRRASGPDRIPSASASSSSATNEFTTIVGVAKNSNYNGIAEEPIPFIYQPLLQNYTPQATLHVRADTGAAALAGDRASRDPGNRSRRSRSSTSARSRNRCPIRWRRCARTSS